MSASSCCECLTVPSARRGVMCPLQADERACDYEGNGKDRAGDHSGDTPRIAPVIGFSVPA